MVNESSFSKVSVKVTTLPHFRGELPKYETSGASGMDVRAQLMGETFRLEPGARTLVPTGLSVEIPPGFEIQTRPRSGWAARAGLTIANTPGTIDSDYRGEIKIILINLGPDPIEIRDQERVAQIVLCPVYHIRWNQVESLEQSDRGSGGFGSTGRG